ncbi:hypothetical protein Ahy_B03g066439 [Arachis hypogaea]|uniref:Ubiquitin-like protease family profile domain-containing protein n=1 Tax=Arachis hypogaea TaxID=3818 RepID=A0A445A490_ARAHY|nr:hypothetical protein Ahy_B03g066439 [Arachis hypogaea]
MTHVKQTKDGTNEYELIFVLKHEGIYEGLREYFMSLMPREQVHAVVKSFANCVNINDFFKHSYIVVSIHNLILNGIKTKRYQEKIYIVPMDIMNFIVGTYGENYFDKSTKKAQRFNIQQYDHYCQFLDKRKFASHSFVRHWWLWIADVNKKKFYVLDPINKKSEEIPDSRKEINKFVSLIIFQMRLYAGAEPLMEDALGEEAEYIQLNGQRTKDKVISKSETIRLTKPSAFLSSPYCKYTSGDLDSK